MHFSTITPGTVVLERRYAAPVERVFNAWSTPEAITAWSDPGPGWSLQLTAFAFREGHEDTCEFGPIGESPWRNSARYEQIVPGRLIQQTCVLRRDGKLEFSGVLAVEFAPDGDEACCLRLVETGLYAMAGEDPAAGHAAGWTAMLDALGAYVSPLAEAAR
jgi:uncharacterized protein YndB with AHSA1/START domain